MQAPVREHRHPLRALAVAAIAAASALPVHAATLQERIAAATATARSTTNSCFATRPFYWEIGNTTQRITGGSVNASGNPLSYTQTSRMNIGSVSKWLFAAYVLQSTSGVLSADQRAKLQHLSGYVSLGKCYPAQTVGQCFFFEDNETLTPSSVGRFDYDGGHMQRLALDLGLGPMTRQQLTTELLSKIGTGLPFSYSVAMPPGGLNGTPAGMAAFLRKLMTNQLLLGNLLGTSPVCTNPATCPAGGAVESPIPATESWEYSLGHWVENDPVQGDGSYSSSGTLGFYPWISADRALYGMVARDVDAGNAWPSVQCGRQVRKAWQTAVPQLSMP